MIRSIICLLENPTYNPELCYPIGEPLATCDSLDVNSFKLNEIEDPVLQVHFSMGQ